MTRSSQWPTDEEICELARDEAIPLFAEAYKIAHQYNRISQALSADQLAGDDLNWCGFAQWSSRAVAIELMLDTNSGLNRELSRRYFVLMVVEPLLRLIQMTLLGRSYGLGLSIANRSIFVEMASLHTNILSGATEPAILQVSLPDRHRKLLQDLGEEGRHLLRTAHKLMSQAKSASGQLRSELVLGANIALSAYEQKRVQPALELVFHRPVRFILRVLWRLPYYYIWRCTWKRLVIYQEPHQIQPPVVRSIEGWWVRMYSKTLSLKTAIDTIRLGRPVLFPPGYSAPLLRSASTFSDKDVSELVQKYGPTDPANVPGVSNWLDYEDRMRFIVAYFMAYQQIRQMFEEPPIPRKQFWRKSRRPDPLANLEIRKVSL
jgi:hypothetical protein